MSSIEYVDDGTGSELILLLRLGLGELDTGRRVVQPHVHVEVSDAVGGHREGQVAQALHSHRELVLFEFEHRHVTPQPLLPATMPAVASVEVIQSELHRIVFMPLAV